MPRDYTNRMGNRHIPGITAGNLKVTTADRVAFLGVPANYPDPTPSVESIETHRSWLFLTDRHAYKFKKPVRTSFLDFSTLERRLENCREEVRLNRRLAPDVYLGVVALVRTERGCLALEAEGEPVEWIVKMKRLPADSMLDRALASGGVAEDDVRRFAGVLSRFYADAKSVEVDAASWYHRTARTVLANRDSLADPRFRLPARSIQAITCRQAAFLEIHGERLTNRVMADRIVEGHGDLRPEHVCLNNPPVFIDCLEFSRELRSVDPADELAYLAMECEMLGAPFVDRVAFDTYGEITGDNPDPQLIDFYKSNRAVLRAKLCVWHLLDHDANEHEKWIGRARDYLALAEQHADRL